MYNGFFGFREKPFKLIPNPKFLFLGKSHENALAHLAYAISQGDGFVEITGEVGAGKTTLCRTFLEDLDKDIEAAFIFNPKLTPVQLLKMLHFELGINFTSSDIIDLTHSLNQFLLNKKAQGKSVILLIDEAQHLGKETLEQLRLLSNLETTRNKLLQIVLVGQPELSTLLNSFNMRQLRQRINLSCHILPLTLEETRNYIDHRILIASRTPQSLFTPNAQKKVYEHSKGIPRKINILCDRSLITAYSLNKKKINASIVNIAAKELEAHKPFDYPELSKDTKIALWPFLAVIFSIIILFLAYNHIPSKWVSGTSRNAGPKTPAMETGKQIEPNPPLLSNIPHTQTREEALTHILSLWGTQTLPLSENLSRQIQNDLDFFKMTSVHHNFLIFHAEHWDNQVEKFNLPAVLKLVSDKDLPAQYMVVSKITPDNEYVISFQNKKDSFKISKKDLLPLLGKDIFIVCRNIFGYTDIISQDSPRFSVMSIKLVLRQLGYTDIEPGPFYGEAVKKAVRQIQNTYGLDEDGLVGPMTKLALIREQNDPSTPFLTDKTLAKSTEGSLK
ncbi:MAG: AAA family ATPase [Proteobacteria bacterium]|nr:AAA family ATPase [Pseudomonadota bacterium]MBU1387614.1 AAA family ATPase [Pseudomonadota bacterium]MBU1544205.1 AAA family ATPase [Pseudomonadota bacterium]